MVPEKPGICSILQNSIMSDINLPFSLLHHFSTYEVLFEEINDSKIGLSFDAKAVDNIFLYKFSKEVGLKFLITCLS